MTDQDLSGEDRLLLLTALDRFRSQVIAKLTDTDTAAIWEREIEWLDLCDSLVINIPTAAISDLDTDQRYLILESLSLWRDGLGAWGIDLAHADLTHTAIGADLQAGVERCDRLAQQAGGHPGEYQYGLQRDS